MNDKLIRRKEIVEITTIKDTKVKELIENGKLIKPIFLDGFNEALYSFNELQEWIKIQKEKRNMNN